MSKLDTKSALILPGQIYAGVATRYVFPPDNGSWWHTPGSYSILIVTVGRIWFEYESFLVSAEGARMRIEPPALKRAKLEEFRKELASGDMTLVRTDAPRVTLVDDAAALPPTPMEDAPDE